MYAITHSYHESESILDIDSMNPAITVKQLFEIALVNAPGIQEGHEEYQPMSRTYAQTSLGATVGETRRI
eukprot:277880-Amorphochlora_amoeboformis.AAC.1